VSRIIPLALVVALIFLVHGLIVNVMRLNRQWNVLLITERMRKLRQQVAEERRKDNEIQERATMDLIDTSIAAPPHDERTSKEVYGHIVVAKQNVYRAKNSVEAMVHVEQRTILLADIEQAYQQLDVIVERIKRRVQIS